jgi:hypothetical protein
MAAAARFLKGHAQQGVVALVAGERVGDGVRRPARVGARDLVARQRGCVDDPHTRAESIRSTVQQSYSAKVMLVRWVCRVCP